MPGTTHQLAKSAATGRSTISRRSLVKGGGILAGTTALLGSGSLAGATEQSSLRLDVACDGRTLVVNRPAGVDPDAPISRGDTFIVQGSVYPAGTIDDGLSGPTQEGRIGHWICRGWFYYGLQEMMDGAAPHAMTTQLYLLDNFDGLVSDGIEGGAFALRPVTGGYGSYLSAGGEVGQLEVEENDTTLNLGDGILAPAPNIRFDFRLTGV
jgi:hypothetical protein